MSNQPFSKLAHLGQPAPKPTAPPSNSTAGSIAKALVIGAATAVLIGAERGYREGRREQSERWRRDFMRK